MELVTWVTACAVAAQTGLFVPLGEHDVCDASEPPAAARLLTQTPPAIDRWAPQVTAAARRFGVPESWVRAVIQLESAGVPSATSPVGAMGLMQLMPRTYAELTARHRLGDNPYDPAANITAGAAYLREMLDQFGAPDAFAAYNAGPGRMLDHLLRGRSLPAETQRYLERILPALSGSTDARAALPDTLDGAPTPDGREPRDDNAPAARLPALRTPAATAMLPNRLPGDTSGALFVPLPSSASAPPARSARIANPPPVTSKWQRGGALFAPLGGGREPIPR